MYTYCNIEKKLGIWMNLKKTSLLIVLATALIIAIYAIQDKTEVEKISLKDFDFFPHNLNNHEKRFKKLFQNLDSEIHILKKNSYFKNFVRKKDDKKKVEVLFLEILEKIPELHQLRYIYKNGKEIIRAQRDQGSTFLVEESKLENKKHRSYFNNIMHSNSNHMWVSKTNENMKNNVILIPNDKILRIGIQVLVDDNKDGILVANIKMDKINISEGEFLQSFRVDMSRNIYIGY